MDLSRKDRVLMSLLLFFLIRSVPAAKVRLAIFHSKTALSAKIYLGNEPGILYDPVSDDCN